MFCPAVTCLCEHTGSRLIGILRGTACLTTSNQSMNNVVRTEYLSTYWVSYNIVYAYYYYAIYKTYTTTFTKLS